MQTVQNKLHTKKYEGIKEKLYTVIKKLYSSPLKD